MNILIRLAYDGTRYHGFQVQKNAVSVCGVLQDAMEQTFGLRPDVKGCSRTDAGVHARDFALNFKVETAILMAKIPLALNSYLPEDIRVKSACQVPDDFHARYSCAGKEYRYQILNAPVDDPFCKGYYHRVTSSLNEQAMHKAGQVLLGLHDFAAFQSAGSSVEDTQRRVTRLSVERRDDWVTLSIAADGFLYNMVRIIAGTLLDAGLGKSSADKVCSILNAKDRQQAGSTLPAKGLFLHRVFYEPDLEKAVKPR